MKNNNIKKAPRDGEFTTAQKIQVSAVCDAPQLTQEFCRLSFTEHIQKLEVESRIKNNSENLKFFRRAFGITLLLTFGVVYLQGFGVFHLSDEIIYALCAATVGQLAGLFVLVLRQK